MIPLAGMRPEAATNSSWFGPRRHSRHEAIINIRSGISVSRNDNTSCSIPLAATASIGRRQKFRPSDDRMRAPKVRPATYVSRARESLSASSPDQGRGQRRGRLHLMILRSGPVGQLALLLLLMAARISVSESFFIDEKQSPQTSEWNYNDQLRWRQMHRDCSGRAQSPIDIKHKNVIISQHLRLYFYNYDQQIKFKLSNAHHTVKMNPTGAAYDQELEQHAGDQRLAGLNSSSIHDIMTVDEYVEFPPTSNQQQTSGVGPKPVGGPDNDHMGRLISASSGAANAAQPIGAASATVAGARQDGFNQNNVNATNNNNNNQQQQPPTRLGEAHKPGRGRHQQSDAIEHERELNHGHASSGFGLFGFQTSKERAAYDGAPTIKLDWLDDGNNEYKLRDIHFHWGERRDNGSEHAIDGRRAAMEMHLVHIKHGLDKSSIGFTSDSVAVIAILIESHRKSNLDFNPIVNELARINSTERAQEVDYKSLNDLLPNNLQAFYTYSGSLTTPPCYQVVNWIVMAERLNMNAKQIEMFRNLYAPAKHHKDEMASALDEMTANHQDHDGGGDGAHNEPNAGLELIMPNVRQLQTLNNRTILASFTKHGSRLESVTSSLNSATSESIHLERYLPILLGALVFQLSLWCRMQQLHERMA